MKSHQNINHDSGAQEYYTDLKIVDAARKVMGTIDLDPSSSAIANKRIKATEIYTKKDNGLLLPWHGNVWMNHPFGKPEKACLPNCKKKTCNPKLKPAKQPAGWRGHCISEDIPGNPDWINKLVDEYQSGNIEQACNISFAATSESWFQPLMEYTQCFLAPRTNYYLPDGTKMKGVTKGSVVTYIGKNIDDFALCFEQFGTIKVRY